MANPRVTACRATEDYRLHLRFEDGTAGAVYVGRLLDIGAFKFWRDVANFVDARVGPEARSVVWPAGIRLDADILYYDLRSRGARPKGDAAFQQFMARAIGGGH